MEEKSGKPGDVIQKEIWSFRPTLEIRLFIEEVAEWKGISKSEAVRECIKGYAILLDAISHVNKASEIFREYIKRQGSR